MLNEEHRCHCNFSIRSHMLLISPPLSALRIRLLAGLELTFPPVRVDKKKATQLIQSEICFNWNVIRCSLTRKMLFPLTELIFINLLVGMSWIGKDYAKTRTSSNYKCVNKPWAFISFVTRERSGGWMDFVHFFPVRTIAAGWVRSPPTIYVYILRN